MVAANNFLTNPSRGNPSEIVPPDVFTGVEAGKNSLRIVKSHA